MRFVAGTEVDPETIELGDVWPRFLLNDKVSNRYWGRLYEDSRSTSSRSRRTAA